MTEEKIREVVDRFAEEAKKNIWNEAAGDYSLWFLCPW